MQDSFNSPVEPTETMTFQFFGITAMHLESWDGSAWKPIPGASVASNNLVWRKFPFAPVTTTKIRVVVDNGRAEYSRIIEVEAY